ncbi:MAG: extracellular solute-binding protein [Oscillospiraceae bacterium]|nr:extracellular solute-binding protein [Oscillospiraceae bacterium]
MKKSVKSILVALLCCVLVLGMVACSNNSEDESSETSDVVNSTITTGEEEQTGITTTTEATGGSISSTTAKSTVYVPPKAKSAYTSPPTYKTQTTGAGTVIPVINNVKGKTLKLLCVDYSQFDDDGTANKYLEKHYGIKVKQYRSQQMNDEIAKSLLSGDPYDLVASDTQIFPELVAQGVMEPIDNCIDFSTPEMKKLKSVYENHAFRGKHYTIPWVSGSTATIAYNIEMFEDANLDLDGDGKKGDTPYSMFQKNTWTWENFLKAAKELAVKNKEGKVTVYGLASRAWTDHQLIYMSGQSIVKTSGKKLVSNLDSSAFQRIYNDYVSLINDSKVVTRGAEADSYEVFNAGSAAMLLAPSFTISGNYYSKIWKTQNVGMVPVPRYNKTSTYYVPGTAFSFYIIKGGLEAKSAGKVNRDLLNAFIHGSLASELEKGNPGSAAYKQSRAEYVAKWSKESSKFTNEWYDEYQKTLKSLGEKVTVYVDPYNASMDVNGAVLEAMLGITKPAPVTFTAAVNEAVGVLNTVLTKVNG